MNRLHAAWSWFSRTPAGRTTLVLLALLCLTLPAAHPALFGALPKTDDAELHLNRLIALDYSVRHGDPWPRYAPAVAYGFGMPIFNYYSPLSLYPMEILHLLGLSFLNAFLIGTILYAFLGLAGAYLLGEGWGGPLSGLVAAVAYAYAPYTLLSWPRRGAVPEFLALALLIWAMWALWRLARYGQRRDLVLAALFFSAVIVVHNVTALVGGVLLGVYSIVLWWGSPQPRRAFVHLALALVLPLGLAAFFWAPALLETKYIFIDRVSQQSGALGYQNYFETLGQVFTPPHTADLTQIRRYRPRPLGWPQLALALLGVLLVARPNARHDADRAPLRCWLLLSAPLIGLFIYLTTRASDWVWQAIPWLHYFRYPWRMLGPASLLLAVSAGAGAALVAQRFRRPVVRIAWLVGVLLAVIVAGLPWLYGVYLPNPVANSIIDVQNFERATGKLGGTSYNEYLPRWTTTLPDADRLMGLYAQSDVIPRLQPAPGVTVEQADWQPLRADLTVRAAQDTTLTFDWLYFPGWQASLDGELVAIVPSQPQGFLTVGVPAGEHDLSLRFGPTRLRRAAVIASLVTLALLVAALFVRPLWPRSQPSGTAPPRSAVWPAVAPLFAAAALAGLVAFAGKALLVDNLDTPLKRARFANGVENGLQTPVEARFDEALTLLGFDLPQTTARSGESVPITLYWTLAGGMVTEDLSSTIVLRDAAGDIVWQTLSFYPGGEPTTTWVPGFYVREPLALVVPPGTPPGTYTVLAGVYSHSLDRNLDVLDAQGSPVGVLAELATLEVTRPRHPARLAELGIKDPLNAHLTGTFTLVSASAPPAQAEVGQELPVIWVWRTTAAPQADLSARLVWLDSHGKVAARSAAVPLVTGYPATQWQRRDVWRGLHMLYVPGRLDPGYYQVAVQLYDPGGDPLGKRAVIGQMAVRTPPRSYFVPEMSYFAGIAWQNGVNLLGYDLPHTSIRQHDGLSITFYWRAMRELTENLTVFVHLIDANGVIVAQRDQIPAGGARPTTGWRPREVVKDTYGLLIGDDVPPGTYRLRVGWYNATTGEQIPLSGDDMFWLVSQTITVRPGS